MCSSRQSARLLVEVFVSKGASVMLFVESVSKEFLIKLSIRSVDVCRQISQVAFANFNFFFQLNFLN